MTKEDKELLIKDLCSRLPYGLIIDYNGIRTTLHDIKVFQLYDSDDVIEDYVCLIDIFGDDDYVAVENIKPYLFPLSSMTEEQQLFYSTHLNYIPYYQRVDWFNENHLDYRGLISMGLAEDATGLNIY